MRLPVTPTRCATVGCPRRWSLLIAWSAKESRGREEIEHVCDQCAHGYLNRPALRAHIVTTDPNRVLDTLTTAMERLSAEVNRPAPFHEDVAAVARDAIRAWDALDVWMHEGGMPPRDWQRTTD
jgi:hypothetical protein